MSLSDWLQVADGPAAPAQHRLLDGLAEMLDRLQPVALDRSRSRLTWTPAASDNGHSAAEIALVHLRRPDWSVRIHAEPSSAVISWLTAHERVDESDGGDDESWTTVVVEGVAALLWGEYEVEETARLGRWYKTRIIDVSDAANPEWLRTSAPLWFWVRRPFPATVTRQRLDFTGT